MDGIASLGLADRSVQSEILKQVLIANSICFATWVCWESETKKAQESQLSTKAISTRYIRRSQRFDEDMDFLEEPCPLPPPGDWQPMMDQRMPKAKISLRAQSFDDGWRLLVGASATIISENGDTGSFGIDLALNELAEEAIQRPSRQNLEMIATIEKTLSGAMLIINSSHRLIGATLQAIETAEKLLTIPLKRGDLLSGPLLSYLENIPSGTSQLPCNQDLEINGIMLTTWLVPLAGKGHRLFFIKPKLPSAAETASTASLSRRELEVLKCLAEGKSNDEIATALSISPNTVKNHLDRVFKKLNVTNRFAAAIASMKSI
ncbi:regulatory LuxR family protein [Prosthecobacter fusiformis]|uniref:Regulatory LuxR family protein n=2 Tax=Prosthecobacter fusiformis TaxID=48464 RepID=A0A4R7RRQ7_9BACT|nr:regulatory LuxR family protein [Prosthecobacter fusiformis]